MNSLSSATPKTGEIHNDFNHHDRRLSSSKRYISEKDLLVDFEQYEKDTNTTLVKIRADSCNCTGNNTIDTLSNADATSGRFPLGITSEEVCSTIPTPILRTFVPESRTLSTVDADTQTAVNISGFVKALVNTIAHALNGDSIVTAPILHDGFPWLGEISVKPGALNGNMITVHREYLVQARILAGGHVLPWYIGRKWRYSDLRTLLVDDLQALIKKHNLRDEFEGIIDTFPAKTWHGRNTDEVAIARSSAIQAYIHQLIMLMGEIRELRNAEKSIKKKRWADRSGASAYSQNTLFNDPTLTESPFYPNSFSDTNNAPVLHSSNSGSRMSENSSVKKDANPSVKRMNSFDSIMGEGIGQIMSLIVNRLLNIDQELRHEISTVSQDLRVLITSTPTEHCHVTKEFKIMPQQAL